MRNAWPKITARLGKNSGYWGSLSTLMTGTLGAQVLGIASVLVLARLYSPTDFGSYAFFFALAGFLSLVGTGCYEQAVFVQATPRAAAETAVLAVLISAAFGGLVFLVGIPAGKLVDQLVPIASIPGFLPLLTLSIVLGGCCGALTALCCQQGQFGQMSAARLVQAVTVALVSLGLGLFGFGPTGLVLGFIAGQAVFAVWLLISSDLLGEVVNSKFKNYFGLAATNSRFPKFVLPSTILNYVGGNAVTLIGPAYFSLGMIGQYNLGQRVAGVPFTVVSSAMGAIFRRAVSPQHREAGEASERFRSTAARLAITGAILILPLALFGPTLTSIAFGEEWEKAGLYIQIIAPAIFARFVVGPLTIILILAEKQKLNLFLQALFMVSAFAAIGAGALTGSFVTLLIVLAIGQTATYALYFFVARHFSRRLGPI